MLEGNEVTPGANPGAGGATATGATFPIALLTKSWAGGGNGAAGAYAPGGLTLTPCVGAAGAYVVGIAGGA